MTRRMRMTERLAGIAVPLFSLRDETGAAVGEMPDLLPLARWARGIGQRIVQILPINETRPGEASPYAALSAFAIDPLYLRLSAVPGLPDACPHDAGEDTEAAIPRDSIRQAKLDALEAGWSRFRDEHLRRRTGRCELFERWQHSQTAWLEDYALFRAASELHPHLPWQSWPAELARRDENALRDLRSGCAGRVEFHRWAQWLCFEQWHAVREEVRRLGVAVMGDLPFAPGADSADAWSEPALFRPGWEVGAPPDDFSETGQNWHLPLYDWEYLRRAGFGWWRRRIEQAAALYDAVRIDHIVGVFRTYSIPLDPTWRPCFHPWDEAAQIAQGDEFLRMAVAAAGDCQVVAEDLGTVPSFVREAMRRHGVPGYKVLRWERDARGHADPRGYERTSIATTGTHDTTTLSVWWEELPAEERAEFAARLSLAGADPARRRLAPALRRSILARLYESGSTWVILPVQDLFGWRERINVPMTVGPGNWNYRLPFRFGARGSVPAEVAAEGHAVARLVRAGSRV